MNYSRCLGLLVEEQSLDFSGSDGQMWTTSRRCLNCGRVHESVIEENRLAQQEKVLPLPGGEPDYQDDEVHLGSEAFVRRAV